MIINSLLSSAIMTAAGGGADSTTWLETLQKGGPVGWVIGLLSVLALGLIVMHLMQIRRNSLVPPDQLQFIDEHLAAADVSGAIDYCLDPANDSYLTRILASGLMRFQKSAFGAFEIKNAIEEAGEDQSARLYRSTDALGVIGMIAPLLGLLGTVMGMVGAFETLSFGAAPDHEGLASNISMALVTTLMGLVLAIPCIALHRYFGNRIDALASEAAMEIERLVLHLESVGVGAATNAAPQARQGAAAPRMTAPGARPTAPASAAAPPPTGGGSA